MIKTLLLIVVALLTVSGLCELLHLIRLSLFIKRGRKCVFTLVILRSGTALEQLSFAALQRRWLGELYSVHIIAVDSYIDDAERQLCLKNAGRDVTLCSAETAVHIAGCISGCI